jgi:hypothetical protein
MGRVLLCTVALVLLGLWPAGERPGSGAAGDWDVSYSNSEGSHTAVMRLEQTDESVKGTVRGSGLADGVIEGKLEATQFNFNVRFYDARRRLGGPTACEAALDGNSMRGYCRQHRQNWAGKRR